MKLAEQGRAEHVFISMANGVLDVDEWLATQDLKRSLMPHGPDFWTQCSLPYAFDPAATCQEFMKAIAQWQPSEEGQLILQGWAGYCFMPGHS